MMDIRKIALLNNVEQTITRPIIKTVVKDIKDRILRDEPLEIWLNNNEDSFETNKNVYDNEINQSTLEILYEEIPN
jgi:hypothetical protein